MVDSQLQAARQARKGVEQVRKRLLAPSPDTVAGCAEPLSEAIGCMERLLLQLNLSQSEKAGSKPGGVAHLLRNEVGQLRRELNTVNALLSAAGAFYQGYGRLLGSGPDQTATYGPAGHPKVISIRETQLLAHG